jgi:hypothetical protein
MYDRLPEQPSTSAAPRTAARSRSSSLAMQTRRARTALQSGQRKRP